MTDIFISYAHEDQERVRPIVEELEKRNWRVFWDRKIPVGENYYDYISKKLDNLHCVLVIWSQHSLLSNWVKQDAEEGNRRKILVPLMLDGVQAPLGFRHLQGADLSEWNNKSLYQPFLELLGAIESRIASSTSSFAVSASLSEPDPVSVPLETTPPVQESQRFRLEPKRKITLPSKKEIGQTVKAPLSKKQIQLAAAAVAIVIVFFSLLFGLTGRKPEKMAAGSPSTASLVRESEALTKNSPLRIPKIGEAYGGGIVFYVDAAGRRGLIAAKADLPGADKYTWIAAKSACQNLVENGYSDWYVPSQDELKKLYQAKSAVGGFASDVYWSSTENSALNAWYQGFDNGYQYDFIKSFEWRVRPVRAFTY